MAHIEPSVTLILLQQYIWGVGLLAASHAASITSTFAGQLLMDGYFGIKVGRHPSQLTLLLS